MYAKKQLVGILWFTQNGPSSFSATLCTLQNSTTHPSWEKGTWRQSVKTKKLETLEQRAYVSRNVWHFQRPHRKRAEQSTHCFYCSTVDKNMIIGQEWHMPLYPRVQDMSITDPSAWLRVNPSTGSPDQQRGSSSLPQGKNQVWFILSGEKWSVFQETCVRVGF